jgi:hypothetical protein
MKTEFCKNGAAKYSIAAAELAPASASHLQHPHPIHMKFFFFYKQAISD